MKLLLLRIVGVAAFGLVVFLAIHAFRSSGATRYAAAQKRAKDACRAFRDQPGHAEANVCRHDEFGPKTFEQYKAAEWKLGAARDAFARQDPASAGRTLLDLTASARRWDEHGTLVSAIFASRMIAQIVDVLDAHGAELDPRTRRAILSSARLEVASHPFERERLDHLWALSHYRETRWSSDPSSSDAALADQMEHDDAAYVEMNAATLLGDVKRCESAARSLGRQGSADFMVHACPRFAEAVRTGKRIEAM